MRKYRKGDKFIVLKDHRSTMANYSDTKEEVKIGDILTFISYYDKERQELDFENVDVYLSLKDKECKLANSEIIKQRLNIK